MAFQFPHIIQTTRVDKNFHVRVCTLAIMMTSSAAYHVEGNAATEKIVLLSVL